MAESSQALPFERGLQRPPAGWERERKFLLPGSRVRELLEWLAGRTATEVHDPARPACWNRTTYLDTADFACLRSSLGRGIARKLRVREYAAAESPNDTPALTGASFLELKETGNGLRTKTRVRLEKWLLDALLSGARVETGFETLFGGARPFPQLTSWYRRETRVSLDGHVRITIDSDLLFSRPIEPSSGEVTPQHPIAREPFSVMEVKSAQEVPPWLDGVLGLLDEVDDFSKYRRGMSHLHPELG